MSRHPKETSVLVSKQNNTVDALLVYNLDPFNSNNLFRDFNTNKIEINGIVECFLLNKAITTAKSKTVGLKFKKEQLWE